LHDALPILIFAYYQHKQTKMHEFITYHNDIWIPTVAEAEDQLKDYNDKVEAYENNDEMRKLSKLVEEDWLPISQRTLKKFKDVNPENKEVKKLNEMDIEVEESRIIAFKTLRDYGEDEQSLGAVQQVEEELSEKSDEAAKYIQELMDKYN